MIEFTSGDLLQSHARYLAQGVAEGNQEGLGTGLALKISRKWPEAQSAFKKHARKGGFKGGDLWVYPPRHDQPGIIYLATQPDMYHATLSYLCKALRNLAKWVDAHEIDTVAMPKIGAGLGKLSWDFEVKPAMINYLSACDCRFIVYEDYKTEYEASDC